MIRCDGCKERPALKDERYCKRCRYAIGCAEAEMQAYMGTLTSDDLYPYQQHLLQQITDPNYGPHLHFDYFTPRLDTGPAAPLTEERLREEIEKERRAWHSMPHWRPWPGNVDDILHAIFDEDDEEE